MKYTLICGVVVLLLSYARGGSAITCTQVDRNCPDCAIKECAWLVPHNKDTSFPLCGDGTYATTWSCANKGGRKQCPKSDPVMCANLKQCDAGKEPCCQTAEVCATSKYGGGARPCRTNCDETTTISATTTTATSTSKTATTTTNTQLQMLHQRMSEIELALEKDLVDTKDEVKRLTADLSSVTKELRELKDFVQKTLQPGTTTMRPAVTTPLPFMDKEPSAYDEWCEKDLKNDCTPQIISNGNDVGVYACCGELLLHSKQCGAVDPCWLQSQITELQNRME